jgi:hypothetical protein
MCCGQLHTALGGVTYVMIAGCQTDHAPAAAAAAAAGLAPQPLAAPGLTFMLVVDCWRVRSCELAPAPRLLLLLLLRTSAKLVSCTGH